MNVYCVVLAAAFFTHSQALSNDFYDPEMIEIAGWTVAVDPKLLQTENESVREAAFQALENHLERITYILPEDRLEKLRKCKIWIELENQDLKNMQFHPGKRWLIRNGQDPRLVEHVHIPHARSLTDPKMWAKHPYVILHELAHAYHHRYYGFDDENIAAAYENAKHLKIYDSILDHRGNLVKHYGMNNPMEYFAEGTEAYLGVNDFYPFVRAELKAHDPELFKLMRNIWGEIAD